MKVNMNAKNTKILYTIYMLREKKFGFSQTETEY